MYSSLCYRKVFTGGGGGGGGNVSVISAFTFEDIIEKQISCETYKLSSVLVQSKFYLFQNTDNAQRIKICLNSINHVYINSFENSVDPDWQGSQMFCNMFIQGT